MGCFSYICPVCGKNIRGGEKCVLIHKREGVEFGRTEGHYDEYGGVVEDNLYRGESGPNSHEEICKSEFGLKSSYHFGYIRELPNGELLDSSSVHQVASAFVKTNGYRALMQEPRLADFLAEKLQESEAMAQALLKISPEKAEMKSLMESILQDKLTIGIESLKYFDIARSWANTLSQWNGATSGTIAVHSKCYRSLDAQSRNTLPFSDPDPEQGCGRPRQIYL